MPSTANLPSPACAIISLTEPGRVLAERLLDFRRGPNIYIGHNRFRTGSANVFRVAVG